MKPALLAALVLLLAAGGCGKSSSDKPATQVAARVNTDEITVHQINGVLSRAPNVPPEAIEQVKTSTLSRLIDQQLALQQALARRLDRTPAVQQALEAARSEILARAYVDHVVSGLAQPTDEEVRKYYAENPGLFARRRVYSLEEVVLATRELPAGLAELVARSRSLQEVAEWLKARAVRFGANRAVRASEQLALDSVPKFAAAKSGDLLLLDAEGWRVVRIAAVRDEPVDEATAAPRIRQFLANRRASDALAKDLKQLKDGAKIEYFGEFAGGPAAEAAKVKAEAERKTKAESEAKAKAAAELQASMEEAAKARRAGEAKARQEAEAKARSEGAKPPPPGAIEKGVSGLR